MSVDPPVPQPPDDPEALLAWADTYGVSARLDDVIAGGSGPVGTSLPGRDGEALTYRQILLAPVRRRPHDADETARGYLHRLAVLGREWNPAVEDQATARAHRIGQTKPVTAVRLVARDTIEEAVLSLHAAKRALPAGVLEEVDLEFWDEVMRINVTTMMFVTRAAQPALVWAGASSIVNIASLAGRKGGHGGSLVYSSAKGAIIAWTRALAAELGPQGVRVNCVAPGLVLGTRFHDTHTTKESAGETVRGIPLGRAGSAEEVARAVVYLASEYDGFITGATLDINGGVYCA